MFPSQELSELDGYAVVDMVSGYHNFDYLTSRVVPLMERGL